MKSKLQTRPGIIPDKMFYTWQYFRFNIFVVHVFGLFGLFLVFKGQIGLSTFTLMLILALYSGFGTSAGAHRLWSHRAYKARTPLKILLATGFLFADQASLWHWAANHRIHHKFTDTPNDPHDSTRGFFYSHVGWLLTYDHEKFLRNVEKIDVSDLDNDKVVMFFHRHDIFFHLTCVWILPTFLPWFFFGEPMFNAFCVCACLRLMIVLNHTFLVNSAAHMWGYRPYDTLIRPSENWLVAILALGEGWHNYHHVFPWDYKTSELGFYGMNWTTAVIEFFAWIGWAYDLKTVDKELIAKRIKRTGHHRLEAALE